MDAYLWGHTGTGFLFFSQMWCRFHMACSLVTRRRWLSLILWSCLCAHTYEKVALELLEAQEWGWLGIVLSDSFCGDATELFHKKLPTVCILA